MGKVSVITFHTDEDNKISSDHYLPLRFFVSQFFLSEDKVEMQPLTFNRLIRAIAKNFILMSNFRLMKIFVKLRILRPESGCYITWRDLFFLKERSRWQK